MLVDSMLRLQLAAVNEPHVSGYSNVEKIRKMLTVNIPHIPVFGGAASKHIGLPVCPSVPVSFWRGFVDNTNV